MDAHPGELSTSSRRGIGTLQWIGLFALAWLLSGAVLPHTEDADRADSYDVSPPAAAVFVAPANVLRPLLLAGGNAGSPPAAVPDAPAAPRVQEPSAARRDPPPSLFHRVSYRTTAPPSENG